MKLSGQDLYKMRHAQLAAQKAGLQAQQAEQAFRELVLEMEDRYDLLGTDASIDIHTGEIHTPSSSGPEIHKDIPRDAPEPDGTDAVPASPEVGVQE